VFSFHLFVSAYLSLSVCLPPPPAVPEGGAPKFFWRPPPPPPMYSQSVTVPFYNSTSIGQPFHVGIMASIIEQQGSPATSQEQTKEKTKKGQCRAIGSNCPMKADPHCTRRVHCLIHLSVPLNYNDYQSNEESRCCCLMTSTRKQ